MPLENVAMVAADTVRSKAYLQAMVRWQVLPTYVIVLRNASRTLLPGQAVSNNSRFKKSMQPEDCWSESGFDAAEPIEVTLRNAAIPFGDLAHSDINDPVVISAIRERPEEVMVYSGFGGTLLRKEVLGTGKRFLHIHGGFLPDYKGSTTNYYSLIRENMLGASSLFLDADIDSGPILTRMRFPAPEARLGIDHVYDSAARAKVLVETLRAYAATHAWQFEAVENRGGETYFIVHPVLKHIALLAGGES